MLGKTPFKYCNTGVEFEDRTVEFLLGLGFVAERVGSNDSGIDIVATLSVEGRSIMFNIQCKFHNNTLSKAPIHEVYAGTHYRNNGGHPVVITNNAVTATGRMYAKKLGVEIIADMEWLEFEQVLKTKHIYNPNQHVGLFGIILSKIAKDGQYYLNTLNGIIRADAGRKETVLTEKEQLKEALLTDFDEAESCIQEAAYMQQKAAMLSQRALDIQKRAILRNLDYG